MVRNAEELRSKALECQQSGAIPAVLACSRGWLRMTGVGREGEVTNGRSRVPKFQWPLFGNELEKFNFGSVP
jgi:hypothetical protein